MGFFDSIAEAFYRDGAVTRFTEKVPLVGLVTAGVQKLAGNGEHAKRALANQASVCITTGGTVGGFLVGGPLGAIAGGALSSSVGVCAEYGVSTTINDAQVKGDTGELSVRRFVTEAAFGGAGGVLGGGGSSAALKQVGTTFGKATYKQMTAAFGREAIARAGGSVGRAALGGFGSQVLGSITVTATSGNPPQPGGEGKGKAGDKPKIGGKGGEKPVPTPLSGGDSKKKPRPELVRAVSFPQAAAGREWILAVRLLNDFPAGKFYVKIDNPNLSPGSCVNNVTRSFTNLPGYLNENVDYYLAWSALELKIGWVNAQLTGVGSGGVNLTDALKAKINGDYELQLPEKTQALQKLAEYNEYIRQSEAQLRIVWQELYEIPPDQIIPPDPYEVDV